VIDEESIRAHAPGFARLVKPDRTVFRCVAKDEPEAQHFDVSTVFRSILTNALQGLEDLFQDTMLKHIGPLRAYPRRFYLLDIANVSVIERDDIVELLRENKRLMKQVNDWLSRFGVQLDVEQLREIIHRLAVHQPTPGLDLDITDVGFGLSQILPVVVQGFLTGPGSLVLIEQSEIHLHPRMQADLADLFIDMCRVERGREERRGFLIETHSEYLLNRLRRRIAEGKIQAKDVAIHFVDVNGNEDHSIVKRVASRKKGAFEWPTNFYMDELEDTMAFLRQQ
jgi:predicted ATPase